MAGAILSAQQPATETPQERFRARTDLVQADVTVLDDRRRPVRGLTKEDFTIFQDGKPQPIEAFSEVSLPDRVVSDRAPWTRDVPPDVVTNQIAEQEGRLVIILLDRTIPLGQPTITAKRIADAAVDALGPGDLAAVVSTSGGSTQELTADRARLHRVINGSDPSTGSSSDERELQEPLSLFPWSDLNDGRCNCGLCVLETITRIGDALQDRTRRRKVLLFIGSNLILQSGGTPGGARTDVGCESRLHDARTLMFTSLGRANLTIHSLDPGGLEMVGPISRASSPLRGRDVQVTLARDRVEHLEHQDALRVLPDRTGGRTVVNTNAPEEHIPDIFRESDGYYLVAFRQTDSTAGKSHAVTVKVRRPGVSVHTRSGYVSPSTSEASAAPTEPAAPTAVFASARTALTGLLPAGEVPLAAQAAAFAAPESRRGAVALLVDVGGFAPLSGAAPGGPLEIVATAFDRTGRAKGLARTSLDVTWPANDPSRTRRMDVFSRLDLAPGDYQVRVGVSGGNPARSASIFSDVSVPDFDAVPLSLSSIVLSATVGTVTGPKDFLASVLPIVPTARRTFSKADRSVAFLRIYEGLRRRDPVAPVTLRTSLLDSQGRDVAAASTVLAAEQFASGRAADYYISLPLSTLASGEYLLRVEAAMGAFAAGRVLRFNVE
jgi:VWFA-related protein